jgi:hypothetical protein
VILYPIPLLSEAENQLRSPALVPVVATDVERWKAKEKTLRKRVSPDFQDTRLFFLEL